MIKPPFTGPVRTVDFKIESNPNYLFILPVVDGAPITTLVELCEKDMALQSGLNPESIPDLQRSQHFTNLGHWSAYWNYTDIVKTVADRYPSKSDKALLAACGSCGDYGCSNNAYVQIKVTDSHIHWYNLRTKIYKSSPYPNFGIITFDRTQYTESCESLLQKYAQHQSALLTRTLLPIEEQYLSCLNKTQSSQLEHHLHYGYVETNSAGKQLARNEKLQSLPEKQSANFQISDFVAHALSPEFPTDRYAIARYTTTSSNENNATTERRTSVWYRTQSGQWQLLSHQSTLA